jgi:hypothetical protein
VNSKVALYFVLAALVGIAFYVVRAKQRRHHAETSPETATESAPERAPPSSNVRTTSPSQPRVRPVPSSK